MKKEIIICLDWKLLSRDEQALKRVLSLLTELKEKGFMPNDKIVFDDNEECEIQDIFNKYYSNESDIK